MAHFILGVDVDGVLADFNHGYIKLLEGISGERCTLAPGEEPPCWQYPTLVGFTKDHERKAWQEIKASDFFWQRLPAYVEAAPALTVLTMAQAEGHEVYFMTNRPGNFAHAQTVRWLELYGMKKPQVLICPDIAWPNPSGAKVSSKGIISRGLGITHLIDDKPENCVSVIHDSPDTRVVLRSRRWNLPFHDEATKLGMGIVTCLEEFFDVLSKDEEALNAQLG